MNFCIMRFAKLKRGDLAKAERHHAKRESLKTREHPEKESMNVRKRYNGKTLLKNVSEIIKNQEEKNGRKVRKDANVCIEYIFTYSSERHLEKDKKAFKEWAEDNLKFAKKASGKNSIILEYCAEFDERTPHMHVFVCPIDSKGNINFKEAVNGKKDIEKMQDEYGEIMEKFGLQRGKKKGLTKAKNKPLQQYYKEQEEAAEKIIIEAKQKAESIIKDALKKRNEYLKECEDTRDEIFKDDDFIK